MLRKLSCVQCGTQESVFMEKSFPDKEDHPSSRVNLSKRIRRPRRQRERDAAATRMTKKAIDFCKENDNFARASRLFVHFFVFTA